MNAADSAPVLQVAGLDLLQGARVLVRDLHLRLGAGECWAVVGANGSGKSTLLRALAGMDRHWRQRVLLHGRPLQALEPLLLARQRAWLPQEQQDVFGLRALQRVLLARHAHAGGVWDSAADIECALQALQLFDAGHLAERDLRQLSGGERQRVSLAALWAQQAPLLLLDEPCNHLDLSHQHLLLQRLQQHCQAGGSALLVAHDVNLLMQVASHALVLLPQARWTAGQRDEVLTAATLQHSLGCALRRVELDGQQFWLPPRAGQPEETE